MTQANNQTETSCILLKYLNENMDSLTKGRWGEAPNVFELIDSGLSAAELLNSIKDLIGRRLLLRKEMDGGVYFKLTDRAFELLSSDLELTLVAS